MKKNIVTKILENEIISKRREETEDNTEIKLLKLKPQENIFLEYVFSVKNAPAKKRKTARLKGAGGKNWYQNIKFVEVYGPFYLEKNRHTWHYSKETKFL